LDVNATENIIINIINLEKIKDSIRLAPVLCVGTVLVRYRTVRYLLVPDKDPYNSGGPYLHSADSLDLDQDLQKINTDPNSSFIFF